MSSLEQFVREEIDRPVREPVRRFAEHLAAPYGKAARAVLFYGSCLRSETLEGEMLDFYLIVSDYEAAYGKNWLARANALLPPNVFPVAHEGLMGKLAVLSEHDFHRLNRREASAVSVWARFAQPSRLAWAADEAARTMAADAIAGAAPTLLDAAMAQEGSADLLDLWKAGFRLTYGAELRAERNDRPGSVVDYDPDRYRALGALAIGRGRISATLDPAGRAYVEAGQEKAIASEKARWPGLRRRGKMLTLARLAKATGTYAGGIDYLAWKINRHAGADIRIKPWQRRHPILGALTLLPQLIAKGSVR